MNQIIEVMVQQRRDEAEGIISLELVAADGGDLPAFTAGAHIDVHVPVVSVVRQYSLVNAPRETKRYVIAVQQDAHSRGGSIGVHQYIKEGQNLQISAPRNHFELVSSAPRFVLIAGGIGITPLFSMAQQLHDQGIDFILHYTTRTEARMAFLEQITKSDFAKSVHIYHGDNEHNPEFDLNEILKQTEPEAHVYVCGPASLIDAVLAEAQDIGLSSAQVHREYFSAETSITGENSEFEITIASTGQSYLIGAEERITDVLEANGVFVPVSCEEGVCGTCLTGVLAGEIDHRDVYLTDEEKQENTQMALCCSRARSGNLTLDL